MESQDRWGEFLESLLTPRFYWARRCYCRWEQRSDKLPYPPGCARANLEARRRDPHYDRRQPVPSLTRGVTHKCDKGHPRVWQGQQRFSEKKDPSTQGTPSLLSCILQISALNVVPHPFASRVESVPYKSKFNGVLGYRNPFEPTLHVRSIRWELT